GREVAQQLPLGLPGDRPRVDLRRRTGREHAAAGVARLPTRAPAPVPVRRLGVASGRGPTALRSGAVTMSEPRSHFRAVLPAIVETQPELGIGMIGYDFMGRAHANAYRAIPFAFWPPPARLRLVALCGRTEERVSAAAERYGFEGYYTDWRDLVADER